VSAADPSPGAADAVAPPVRLDVVRGAPTPEELAAVIAVVGEAYASEAASAVAEDARRPSAWQLSARSLRQPLRRDLEWGSYGG
jgi:hypothetical protein